MVTRAPNPLKQYLGKSWVLVVEPEKNYKTSIKGFLANMKVDRMKVVSSAQEAYRELLTTQVGLFIVEWGLPRENGIELCRELRKQLTYMETPYLLMSVENLRQDVVLASEVLIDGYLLKPFSFEDFTDAIEKIVIAKKKPSEVNTMILRAARFMEDGHLDKARELYDAALKIQPDSARALCGIGAVCNGLGDKETAIKNFKQAIGTNENYVDAYRQLLDTLLELEQYTEAYEIAKKVNVISPGNPKYTMIAAKSALEMGEISESEKFFKQTIRLSPKLAEAYKGLGNVNLVQEDYQSAMKNFKKSLDLDRSDISVLNSLGLSYVKLGKINEGMEKYRAALKLAPHDPKILFNLGYAKEKIGDLPDALFYYKRALDCNPDFEKAQRRLELLQQKMAS